MDIAQTVKNTLSGFVASGAEKEAIIAAFNEWSGGNHQYEPSGNDPGDAAIKLTHTFLAFFPDLPAPEDAGFFGKVINAANGNLETAEAVFGILRQSRERGEWRDESFPAGLVFWFLKNKEHDKLRKQGYAIRKQREAAEEKDTPTSSEEIMALNKRIGYPPSAPVETAAFAPSANGLDRVKAALSGMKPANT